MNSLFVHIPAQLLPARMPYLLNRRLQPEVACQEVGIEQLDLEQMKDCAAQLAAQGLATTVHAPFNGFNPGSPKKRLRKTAHQMCQQSLQLAEALGARCMVFHPGIPHQASQKVQNTWLETALEFWPQYIEQAQQLDLVLTVENIYERSPELFRKLFTELGSDHFGHCFDVGHWNIFAEDSLADWFDQTAAHIKHLHLHDNQGQSDQHLPLGSGEIDFTALLQLSATLSKQPTMTLEAHKLADLEISLQKIESYLSVKPEDKKRIYPGESG